MTLSRTAKISVQLMILTLASLETGFAQTGQPGHSSSEHSQHQAHSGSHAGHTALHQNHLNQENGAVGRLSATGQSGFAAIQEVLSALDADPETDWSKVDLDALRSHLIDMDRVMMSTQVTRELLPTGMRLVLTGDADTQAAINRMIPAHTDQVRREFDWRVEVTEVSEGLRVDIEADDEATITRIRALGFAGFMALGNHHQLHHWQMATGGSHQHPTP